MTTQRVLIVGAIVGLSVSAAVLALLWLGVSGVLIIGRTDFMYVFWPSSLMLTIGWHRTIPGITITILSILFNCLMYMALFYVLRIVAQLIRRS